MSLSLKENIFCKEVIDKVPFTNRPKLYWMKSENDYLVRFIDHSRVQ